MELASIYQAATLVALPSYPNSIAWSKENLVAIPSENLITILNPASLTSARALITLQQNKPFRIGLVERKDLHTPCLQPICLSRVTRPYARSISWSPSGLAPNSGCFLAVCTTDGHAKLYRAPHCEYNSEWIEILDVSDLLFDYLSKINYCKHLNQLSGNREVKGSGICNSQLRLNDMSVSFCNKFSRSRKRKEPSGRHADSVGEASLHWSNAIIACPGTGTCYINDGISLEDNVANTENGFWSRIDQSSKLPHITAEEYASHSAGLSSLVVTWSPMLKSSDTCFSILSVGVKSGAIYFWKIAEPHYTIVHSNIPVNAKLIGFIQAHNSWITAICFGFCADKSSESQLVLATGSSDGSVKIWSGNVEELLLSEEVKCDCFSLLTEVTAATFIPISTIALTIPEKSPQHVVLSLGSGAGMLEVWVYDILVKKLHFGGDYNAHEQVVTGLVWAFDGRCLYSCSQDNSIRSWIFYENSLYEVPFYSKFPTSNAFSNLSRVYDLCFGLALSPGGLILAVVRSLDANLQNQMYEKRSQKAVVEFVWTVDQSLEVPIDKNLDDCRFDAFKSSCEPEQACWEANILRVLMYFENVNNPVVIWDAVTSLLNLRKDFPGIVKKTLTKWISMWFSDSSVDSPEKILILFRDHDNLLMVSSRKFQLLNVVCRRVMLSEMEFDIDKDGQLNFDKLKSKGGKLDPWIELLVQSERELRERLVAFSFQAVLNHTTNSQGDHGKHVNWSPLGVAQMEQWTAINQNMIHSSLKVLGSEVAELMQRNHNGIPEYVQEESCGFCSTPVPFESPEIAWCEGILNQKGSIERHRVTRCAASMRLCSVLEPMWHCICCKRLAANLLPHSFFTMQNSPLDFKTECVSIAVLERPKPLCPFCGILLQRPMPDFLLSTSPV